MQPNLLAVIFALAVCSSLPAADQPLSPREKAAHVLNRLTWGPRPGDIQALLKQGWESWLKDQLNPDQLDDGLADQKLSEYPDLKISMESLVAKYPDPLDDFAMRRVQQLNPENYARFKNMNQGQAYVRIYHILSDLRAAKMARLVYSERQLYEVMVDFWFNHFNVTFEKDQTRWFVSSYERDAIRPHALGRFRDLLAAAAKHPAMLVYLDNAMSRSEKNPFETTKAKPMRRNENFAREILELHTLGVDGGYSQQDVLESARILTGWGVDGTNGNTSPRPIQFRFKPWHHDAIPKRVLGKSFESGGIEEGEALLDLLASHPATARHLATKLCRRFVADEPPAQLVDKVAQRFLKSDGDIRQTLWALFSDPLFFDRRFYRQRFKTPLEFAAGSLRALRVDARGFGPVDQFLESQGMAQYTCPPPTGYKIPKKNWLSPSALLGRANFARSICEKPDSGPLRYSPSLLETQAKDIQKLAMTLMGSILENGSLRAIQNLSSKEEPDLPLTLSMILASPDFQRK